VVSGSINAYVEAVAHRTRAAAFRQANGAEISADGALAAVLGLMRQSHAARARVWIIGNGGSAAIASHMANDLTKNGGIRASAISDAAMLTCLANDFGYEQVFARALAFQAGPKDGLIAISSSGNSANILNAVAQARQLGCWIFTLSGFHEANKLRGLGDYNAHVASANYGTVELAHLILLHALLDLAVGWRPDAPDATLAAAHG
jgi:D-sedoheptulose 7-phosphate isomerase